MKKKVSTSGQVKNMTARSSLIRTLLILSLAIPNGAFAVPAGQMSDGASHMEFLQKVVATSQIQDPQEKETQLAALFAGATSAELNALLEKVSVNADKLREKIGSIETQVASNPNFKMDHQMSMAIGAAVVGAGALVGVAGGIVPTLMKKSKIEGLENDNSNLKARQDELKAAKLNKTKYMSDLEVEILKIDNEIVNLIVDQTALEQVKNGQSASPNAASVEPSKSNNEKGKLNRLKQWFSSNKTNNKAQKIVDLSETEKTVQMQHESKNDNKLKENQGMSGESELTRAERVKVNKTAYQSQNLPATEIESKIRENETKINELEVKLAEKNTERIKLYNDTRNVIPDRETGEIASKSSTKTGKYSSWNFQRTSDRLVKNEKELVEITGKGKNPTYWNRYTKYGSVIAALGGLLIVADMVLQADNNSDSAQPLSNENREELQKQLRLLESYIAVIQQRVQGAQMALQSGKSMSDSAKGKASTEGTSNSAGNSNAEGLSMTSQPVSDEGSSSSGAASQPDNNGRSTDENQKSPATDLPAASDLPAAVSGN